MFFCENNCFYCNKKNILNIYDEPLSINVCCKCVKVWRYTYSRCKIDSIDSVCVDCIEKDKSDVSIEIYKPPPSLSPITTHRDKDEALKIRRIFPFLSELAVQESTTLDQCGKFTKLHFTQLHPDNHNIVSPNSMNSKPIDGMLISPNLLQIFWIWESRKYCWRIVQFLWWCTKLSYGIHSIESTTGW